jgi:hypothetical protein
MLKDEIKIKKNKLTCQTCDLDYEVWILLYKKKIETNYKVQLSTNQMLNIKIKQID